ncbi:hypothetical protein V9K67_24440 [Paraflavisolibacter sp. H34]|uniref:hypothetical protein n=1 Tax=Huijunlia imazamoxiresistens TaxID=3127457 RepID=UPI00301B5F0F
MKKRIILYGSSFTLLFLLVAPFGLLAQKGRVQPDTLSAVREFLQVSKVYQQLPLSMDLLVTQIASSADSPNDTVQVESRFFLDKSQCYVRLGEMEQFIDDSLALMVSNQAQRMFLSSNVKSVTARMQLLSRFWTGDSSVQQVAKQFNAEIIRPAEGKSVIRLSSRSQLYGTSLPRETIEMQCNSKTKLPEKVIQWKRRLLPLEEEAYKALSTNPEKVSSLLAVEGKGYFFISEQVTTFLYREIGYGPSLKLPATIKDRISKNSEGDYVPVRSYAGYAVTIN